jgi:hypothetical protein
MPSEPTEARDGNAAEVLLLLVVGALLEGSDVLHSRLQRWDTLARADRDNATSGSWSHPMRTTLLGTLFESQASMRRGVSSLGRLGKRMLGRGVAAARPLAAFVPVDVLLRWDTLLERAQLQLDRWQFDGHGVELQGRSLARHALAASMDELMDYLAHEPQLRSLIEQQSIGFAGEAVGEVRTRAASADAWVEQVTHALLRRAPRNSKPAPKTPAIVTEVPVRQDHTDG